VYKLVFITAGMLWIAGSNKLVTVCKYKGPAGDYVSTYIKYNSLCKTEIKIK